MTKARSKALPRPRPCLIVALELLGLDDPTVPEGRAREALTRVEYHLGDDADLAKHYESQLQLGGKHILYAAPIKPAGMLPFWLALNVVHLQASLAPLGVLLRGAISLGEAAARAGLVFGPGVADTERLRDELALVPRVIVDPRLLREVEQNPDLRLQHHTAMDELGYLRNLLRLDADGLWFVDYLWAMRSEVDGPLEYFDVLQDHRRMVMNKLDAATTLDQSPRTSTWLWYYHNLVCDMLKDEEEAATLRIPATSPLVYRFPPSVKAP